MENFEIRTYGRTELALCYFPDLNPQVAYRKLQYWIDYYPHLSLALLPHGLAEKRGQLIVKNSIYKRRSESLPSSFLPEYYCFLKGYN